MIEDDIFRIKRVCSSTIPVPIATQDKGSSALMTFKLVCSEKK